MARFVCVYRRLIDPFKSTTRSKRNKRARIRARRRFVIEATRFNVGARMYVFLSFRARRTRVHAVPGGVVSSTIERIYTASVLQEGAVQR